MSYSRQAAASMRRHGLGGDGAGVEYAMGLRVKPAMTVGEATTLGLSVGTS
jgi:hypothetical protein